MRRANARGTISLYKRDPHVAKAAAGRDGDVSLDPTDREWIYADARGMTDRRQPTDELTADHIRVLDVSHHRPPPAKVAVGAVGSTACRATRAWLRHALPSTDARV